MEGEGNVRSVDPEGSGGFWRVLSLISVSVGGFFPSFPCFFLFFQSGGGGQDK
jgi:hypothetical protein